MTTPTQKQAEQRTHVTSFGAVREGVIFQKRQKLNPKEHDLLVKTGRDCAAYCDENGEVISNHFLLSLNMEVLVR